MDGCSATRAQACRVNPYIRYLTGIVVHLAALLALALPVRAQSAENVAIVINDNSAVSQVIGEHYAQKRGLPASNVLRIKTVPEETIARAAYEATIERPISAAIAREGLQDRILYIVLTKGIPLRISGTPGLQGTVSSVDSELTLLYRQMTGNPVTVPGRIDNPFFLGNRDIDEARRFTHRDQDIYLVSRLDGFTVAEALALVDVGVAPATEGRIVLDQRVPLVNRTADDWLAVAAQKLIAQGHGERVLLETTPKPAQEAGPVLGYYSWGATDPQLHARRTEMRFAPGALAATFAGTDARTLQSPPDTWLPMQAPNNRSTHFAGSPQSLIGDLIREGVTGVAGHVAEPFLESVVRPEVLFPAYLSGFNLIESFYLAMPFVGWQTIVIGDPLCAPFSRSVLTRTDIDGGIDQLTELPKFFSDRRMEVATSTYKVDPEAAALILRAEVRLSRQDVPGGRDALEEALALSPDLVAPHLTLAALDERAGAHDAAIARYRRVLEIQPNNATALNNLAFALATHKNAPAEAKPLAEKAMTLTKDNAAVMDTLGWIEYLLGNHAAAVKLVAEAVRRAPGQAEIRVHAAFAYAAVGDRARAETQLKEALRLNPQLAKREDVGAVRSRIESIKP
jgi:uncharacterized protein (TIGR03790 family)